MKTWRLFFYLAIAVVAIAPAHSQNYSFVQIGPLVQGGSIPNPCGQPAYTFQFTGSYGWGLYCPDVISPYSQGTVSGLGTGACPTSLGSLAPCSDPGGSYAPTFTIYPQPQLVGTQWIIYEQIGNASLTPATPAPALFFYCGPPSYTQATATTQDVQCPKPCPPNVRYCQTGSPIVIDPTGEGFFLTDKQHGVEFRKESAGPIQQMSWTDPAHHNVWLVRPNADGSVTSLAANMFGNLSPQPSSNDPNGYLALAYWAEQEGCGTLDALDFAGCPAVWQQLRGWHDANQDGIAQPDELSTLETLGIHGISLKYHESGHKDQYGNQFRYVASIYDDAGEKKDRCYDVFLLTQ